MDSFASLHQHGEDAPRNAEENKSFKRAIDVMGSCYASVTGTCVLQAKDIPPRPSQYDGLLCLFDGTRAEIKLGI